MLALTDALKDTLLARPKADWRMIAGAVVLIEGFIADGLVGELGLFV